MRSSSRSLLPSLAFFVVGLALTLGSEYLPEALDRLARVVGTAAILACVFRAYWFHRWEVVDDDQA